MQYQKILEYLYPPRCPVCDRIFAQGICESCGKKLVRISDDYCMKCGKPLEGDREEYCRDCRRRKHYFEQGRSLFSYQGRMRQSLYRLKYANRREYAGVYGREAAVCLGSWIRRMRITRIVPVPLHFSRRQARGYNQAALIAREIGRQMELPVDEKLLRRVRKTAPLKMLTGRERREALAGAFRVRGDFCRGERILLVDDIYTTGHTADAAAYCLRQAADCRVYVLTVAIGG
ncbi:MAG: ComF family protein [Clostridiales bacterium]|nr:ComF family protein [Clostridiales bacterium]